jgi:hypothetical protein
MGKPTAKLTACPKSLGALDNRQQRTAFDSRSALAARTGPYGTKETMDLVGQMVGLLGQGGRCPSDAQGLLTVPRRRYDRRRSHLREPDLTGEIGPAGITVGARATRHGQGLSEHQSDASLWIGIICAGGER